MAQVLSRLDCDVAQVLSGKFCQPEKTADGQTRASVAQTQLKTLWFNTGTLCNLTCHNCYIESSPTNDRLVYLSAAEVCSYLDEIAESNLPTEEIGFTGGEPFMNPQLLEMLQECLERGFQTLTLTNAMRPMRKKADDLLRLRERFPDRLVIRVSLDHYDPTPHDQERGRGSYAKVIDGLVWLARQGFKITVAGRSFWDENESDLRRGYAELFARYSISLDAHDPVQLVIFPEMDLTAEVPEITESCWGILGVEPDDMMCASSRMVVKRKGEDAPVVAACTLLPYDDQFALGHTLEQASGSVWLNHPHCAKFCVLGGGSCSKS